MGRSIHQQSKPLSIREKQAPKTGLSLAGAAACGAAEGVSASAVAGFELNFLK
jgi:hypothetical protein